MKHYLAIVTVGLMSAAACAPAPAELSVSDRQVLHDEVAEQLDSFWQVWSEADFDRGMALYDDHLDFSFVSEGAMWRSRGAVDSAFRPAFANVQRQELTFDETHIAVLGPGLAYSAQRGTASETLADGTTMPTRTVAFTLVWVRSNGEWKVRFAHHSEP